MTGHQCPLDDADGASRSNRPKHHGAPSKLAVDLRALLRRRLDRSTDCGSLVVLGHRRRPDPPFEVLARGRELPERAILGFSLPASYDAVAVVAPSVVARPPARSHVDAALAVGVDRAGSTVSMLTTAEGVLDTTEPQGWLIDACLRAVGLSTPTQVAPAIDYPLVLWLDRLMVEILARPAGGAVSWKQAAELCPVPRRWRSLEPVDLGTTLASTTPTWHTIRARAARNESTPFGTDARWAGWMDDPMFARWCLGSFPELATLWADVEFLAAPEVAECVGLTVRTARSSYTTD